MFLTPAHIDLLNDSASFIQNTVGTLFDKIEVGQKIDALAAVVDGIPVPETAQFPPEDRNDYRDLTGNPNCSGYQGITMGICDSSLATPDLWSRHGISSDLGARNMDQHSTLSFSFTGMNQVSRTLQIPVANTIFQNGMPATLFAQRWIRDRTAGGLVCVKQTPLQHQTVHMTETSPNTYTESDTYLRTRLRPITRIRTATAAVGNIIRRVEVDGGQERPASQELESIINDQIQNGHLDRDKVQVWALLTPPNELSSDSRSNIRCSLQEEIVSGARLLKVLSGGGGWGQKQGLLALDPDSHYGFRDSPSYSEESNATMKNGEGFADIVKPGDNVKFLINDVTLTEHSIEKSKVPLESAKAKEFVLQDQLLEFGCVPPTLNVMPASEVKESPHMLIDKYLGLLSEHGMSLKSTFPLKNELEGNPSQRSVTTKLDAPCTLLSVRPRLSDVVTQDSAAQSEVNKQPLARGKLKTDADPPEHNTTLNSLETACRARKQADRQKNVDRTWQKFSKSAKALNGIICGPEMEHTSEDVPESPGFTTRKYMALPKGDAKNDAFVRFRKRKSAMNEAAVQRYITKVYQGGTTTEALAYAEQPLENREKASRTSVRWTYPGSLQQKGYVSTRPMGEGPVRRYGVSESNPKDKAKLQFRIAKHPSSSGRGKAKELQDRIPITSRDRARHSYNQYHLILGSDKHDRSEISSS